MVKRLALYSAAMGYIMAVVWYGLSSSPYMPESVFYFSQVVSTVIWGFDGHPGAAITLFFMAPIQGVLYGLVALLAGWVVRSVARQVVTPITATGGNGREMTVSRKRHISLRKILLWAGVWFLSMASMNWYEATKKGWSLSWNDLLPFLVLAFCSTALFTGTIYVVMKYGVDQPPPQKL